ncbi:inositol monophosphatase family protein [Halopiger xanaduensis]|uniref:Inositol monophosphatase n=1 Tax=Halopiger xanaduensis (strain DSM 18323 / JCM 14033 / SH-6) TaxID=797210 RepID=F8DDH8_HALXS|nr:inositol monophosphatase family protein [Halopiger xanaduensis]AEH39072.1 inositol monophosphatase [Halopiger xanaduensis SH-6]
MARHPHLWAALLAARRGAEALAVWDEHHPNCTADRETNETCDVATEKAILTELERHFPEHNVISEESYPEFSTKPRWIVDPLDGRINYLNGIPHYSVSIAFEGTGAADVSVVYHIPSDRLFTAIEGQGAYLNGRPISVSETATLSDALVVTGFDPTTIESQHFDQFRSLLDRTQGVRRFGSAATELAMVADGQFDIFFERELSVWDTAAGIQLVEEAGGEITRIERVNGSNREMVLASNPQIHQEAVSLISSSS